MFIVTMAWTFIPAPAHAPPHPPNVPPAVAVSVTTVPWLNSSLQVPVVQLMLPGLDMTLPMAPPVRVTVTSS